MSFILCYCIHCLFRFDPSDGFKLSSTPPKNEPAAVLLLLPNALAVLAKPKPPMPDVEFSLCKIDSLPKEENGVGPATFGMIARDPLTKP